MAFIELNNPLPGIRGLMAYRPETASPLNQLAEQLLRNDDNSLSRGEREFIAGYVSSLNDCFFCENVHGALAGYYLNLNGEQITKLKSDPFNSDLTSKMKALLKIAASVQKSGKAVTEDQILDARKEGATDLEIHDTVLIAAAFCMFNRYVDGLNTWAPTDPQVYIDRAPQRAKDGYVEFDLFK